MGSIWQWWSGLRRRWKIAWVIVALFAALTVLGSISPSPEEEQTPDGDRQATATAPAAATATPTPALADAQTPTAAPSAAQADTSTSTPEPTPTPTPEAAPEDPALGDRVQVGSLDLSVLGIEQIDTTQFNSFNDQNLRIYVLATNARGGEGAVYNLSAVWAFKLVDSNGVVHDAGLSCAGCPALIADAYLPLGRSTLGYVYFEFPPDRDPVELIYEPLFSGNKARIDLTRTGNDAGTPLAAPTPERLPGQPTVGDVIQVGSLDLTVLEHGPFETDSYNPFNTANYAVRIFALNARGDADEEYNVSAFLGFELIDTDGIHHDADFVCVDCPDVIDDVDLVRGGRIEGLVYFEVPDDVHIVELRYAPLWSMNVARIWLR